MSKQSTARNARGVNIIITVIIIVVLAAGVAAWNVAYKSTERAVTATVEGKERVCSRDSDGRSKCEYLVFTDEGTFKVVDSFLYGRFDSSDVYGRLDEDTRYRFDVAGFRLPFLSQYPNIVSTPEEIPG